jgi:prophage maintenance system killer protein
MMQSLASNLPLVDGSKRVTSALTATAVFLRMNGFLLVVDAPSAEAFLIERVIVAKCEIDEIARWFTSAMRQDQTST